MNEPPPPANHTSPPGYFEHEEFLTASLGRRSASTNALAGSATFSSARVARASGGGGPKRHRLKYYHLFALLQFLSIIPSLCGFAYSLWRLSLPAHTHTFAHGPVAFPSQTSPIDWILSAVWTLACAYFSHSLARGLLRRWIVYYTFFPTVVRVLSLQVICWSLTLSTHRVLTIERPVVAWLICASTAAVSNGVQHYVTSNIVEKKDKRGQKKFEALSSFIALIVGSGVRTDKLRMSEKTSVNWKKVLWGTFVPFTFLLWITSALLLLDQEALKFRRVQFGPAVTGASELAPSSAAIPGVSAGTVNATIHTLILISSSWDAKSRAAREHFRRSSIRLIPEGSNVGKSAEKAANVLRDPHPGHAMKASHGASSHSFTHLFMLGMPPTPHDLVYEDLSAEEDLLFVPALDASPSHKALQGFAYAAEYGADYLITTDESVFTRFDVIADALRSVGRSESYWTTFEAKHMVFSHDVVQLLARDTQKKRHSDSVANSVALWLSPYDVVNREEV